MREQGARVKQGHGGLLAVVRDSAYTASMRHLFPFFALYALVSVALAADPAGTITLHVRDAVLEARGGTTQFHGGTNRTVIGHWNSTNSVVSWKTTIPVKAAYRVVLVCSCDAENAGSEVLVEVGGQRATGTIPATGWGNLTELDLGPVLIRKPGEVAASVRALSRKRGAVMNLKEVKLVPE